MQSCEVLYSVFFFFLSQPSPDKTLKTLSHHAIQAKSPHSENTSILCLFLMKEVKGKCARLCGLKPVYIAALEVKNEALLWANTKT